MTAAGRALIACPQCDTLYFEPEIREEQTASCLRCGRVLAAPRTNAYLRTLSLSLTAVILMIGAVFFPFIELEAAGLRNRTSVLDAILAFSSGLMLPLSLAVALLIVLIPLTRLAAIVYTIYPLARRRRPFAHAATAFRLAEGLRPWSMAEIFIFGVSVALVKVAGLASVSFGPAFWAFAGLVVVMVLQDNSMCRYTIWKSLEQERA
ncbi:paraquat-inducible protein A [Psychromarinibacter sp. C21-152]|uniref:Paraquat-inducible protein A n=1 Tax=Psychromarinibacter sediminicola TaxID=3033385 RepID=A0AAE3NTF2_9RHOB|nr:paraquat-inducible protein A [Psychromarinibacter sediminicola]MDF0600242.1 paraquat-inducible protein A [Psychromarinibacter sediminicola]